MRLSALASSLLAPLPSMEDTAETIRSQARGASSSEGRVPARRLTGDTHPSLEGRSYAPPSDHVCRSHMNQVVCHALDEALRIANETNQILIDIDAMNYDIEEDSSTGETDQVDFFMRQ